MKEHYFFVHDFLYVFGIGLYACKIKYLLKKKKIFGNYHLVMKKKLQYTGMYSNYIPLEYLMWEELLNSKGSVFVWIQFILLKIKNWKRCNKIIFKCVNSVMRPIFIIIFFWIKWLWVPWIVRKQCVNSNFVCVNSNFVSYLETSASKK